MRLITLIPMAGVLVTAGSAAQRSGKSPPTLSHLAPSRVHEGPMTGDQLNGLTVCYPSWEIVQKQSLHGTPRGCRKELRMQDKYRKGGLHSDEFSQDWWGTTDKGRFKNSNMTQVCTQHIPVGAQHAMVFPNGCSFPEKGVNTHVNGGPNASIAPYIAGQEYYSFDKSILFMATVIIIIAITKQKRFKCLLLELKKTIDDIQRQERIIDEFNLRHGQWCCLRRKNSHCFLKVFDNCTVLGLLIPKNVLNKALSEGIPINSSAPFPPVVQLERTIITKILFSETFKYWVLHQMFVPEDQHELFTVSIQGTAVFLKLAQKVKPDDIGVMTIGDQPVLIETLCSEKGLRVQENMDKVFADEEEKLTKVFQKKISNTFNNISALFLKQTLTPLHWEVANILCRHSEYYFNALNEPFPFKDSLPTPDTTRLHVIWTELKNKVNKHEILTGPSSSLVRHQNLRNEISKLIKDLDAFMKAITQFNCHEKATKTALSTFIEDAKKRLKRTEATSESIAKTLCNASEHDARILIHFLSGNGIPEKNDDPRTASPSMVSIRRSMISMSADSHCDATIAKEIEAFVNDAITGTLKKSDRVHFDMHMGNFLALTRDAAEAQIYRANKERQRLHLPIEQPYFHHRSDINQKPIRDGVYTMLDDDYKTLIATLNSCNYDTENLQLDESKHHQFIKRLTTFYVNRMTLKNTQGGHHTYIGPYMFPNKDLWQFIGNRPDMIADAYIRLRLLIHYLIPNGETIFQRCGPPTHNKMVL